MGGGGGWVQKGSPTSFSPVTLPTQKLAYKTLWLLILTLFPHWCKISRPYLVLLPNYWTWTKTTPQKKKKKKEVNLYKIEFMRTSFLAMLELPNFGHMTPGVQYNLSHMMKFCCGIMDRNYNVIIFISKCQYFKKTWSKQFYWHQNFKHIF